MKRAVSIAVLFAAVLMLAGSALETEASREIDINDVTEFYYTYDNINYNAFYQRYRFYIEDGKYLFYHETREVIDGYGPAGEEDITRSGTIELTDTEWEEFFGFLADGTVKARDENPEDGDSGPWMYLYWNGDESLYQEFSFGSLEERTAFVDFCEKLIETR